MRRGRAVLGKIDRSNFIKSGKQFLKLTMPLKFVPKGPSVYFPNLLFTMVRSGKPRIRNQFVFRVPTFLHKYDIIQYFEGLYGLKVKEIKTRNFLPKETRQGRSYTPARKNAIIQFGGKEFTYPELPHEAQLQFPLQNTHQFRRER